MASTIVTKNSSTASAVPLTGDLTQGELAVNVTDKKLYTKDSGGTVVKLVGGLGNQEANAVAITGGSVNGTTIGATTASTGAFTTLSASSTTTLSGGTANGVAYLNGSKVVTTGSALTFDGTNVALSGAMSIGGASLSAGNKLLVRSGLSDKAIGVDNGSNSGFVVQFASGLTSIGNDFNAPLAFLQNNAEQMRLTSTGLGIGTSSPGYKLDVNSGASTTVARLTSTGTSAYLGLTNSGATTYIGNDSTSGSFIIQTPASSFSTKLTLDNTGNLGLGVTPSSWSGVKAFQVSNASVWSSGGSNALYSANVYYDGTSRKYISTDYATEYQQSGGQHFWKTAASGTAGNAITFTQAMTLDASGRLVVGATSTSAKLQVSGASANTYLLIDNAAAGENYFAANSANIFQTAGSERARINSSGQLLIGGTNAGAYGANLIQQLSSGTVWSVGPITGQTAKWYVINGSGTGVYLGDGNTSWTANSDERLKDIIEPIENAASKVSSLRAVIGKYKTDDEGTRRSFLIAQDVQAVLPEAVDASNPESLGVQYTDVIPLLVAAIKEQQALITQLTERITALEGK